MDKAIAYNKAKKFSFRIINMYKFLIRNNEQILSKQILRCGTAIGALLSESIYAQSQQDFINKLSIARKEGNETLYWLELLYEGKYIEKESFESMYKDCDELMRLMTSMIKTLKKAPGIL